MDGELVEFERDPRLSLLASPWGLPLSIRNRIEETLIIDEEVFWQRPLIITEAERMQRELVIIEEQRLKDNDNTKELVAESN